MNYRPVAGHERVVKKVMDDPESKITYEAFRLHLELAEQLKRFRKKAHSTQEQVADRMHTYKPTISRLESASSSARHAPSVITLLKYAAAVGCELKIILSPKQKHLRIRRSRAQSE